jgi:hypothetical protein
MSWKQHVTRSNVLIGSGAVAAVLAFGAWHAWQSVRESNAQRAKNAEANQVHRDVGKLHPETPVEPGKTSEVKELANQPVAPVPYSYPSPSPPPPPTPQNPPVPVRLAVVTIYHAPAPPPKAEAVQFEAERRPKKRDPKRWLPQGGRINCMLLNAVKSSSLNTPVQGIVTEDIRQVDAGIDYIIIPKNSRVTAWAVPGSKLDRIEVAGGWTVEFSGPVELTGKLCRFEGAAVVGTPDKTGRFSGEWCGSAGLQGQLVNTDHWKAGKDLLELVMLAGFSAAPAAAGSFLQASHSSGFYQTPDATPIFKEVLDDMFNGRNRDSMFVKVASGTPFTIFTHSVIVPDRATYDGSGDADTTEREDREQEKDEEPALSGKPLTPEAQMLRESLAAQKAFNKDLRKVSQPQQPAISNDQAPRFK